MLTSSVFRNAIRLSQTFHFFAFDCLKPDYCPHESSAQCDGSFCPGTDYVVPQNAVPQNAVPQTIKCRFFNQTIVPVNRVRSAVGSLCPGTFFFCPFDCFDCVSKQTMSPRESSLIWVDSWFLLCLFFVRSIHAWDSISLTSPHFMSVYDKFKDWLLLSFLQSMSLVSFLDPVSIKVQWTKSFI